MSTILDALQKARRERPSETEGYDVLDPKHGATRRRNRRTMVWVVLLTIVATMVVLGLTGAALLMLLDRLDARAPTGEGNATVARSPNNVDTVGLPAMAPPTETVAQPAPAAQVQAQGQMPLVLSPDNTGATELPVAGPENPATLPTPLPSAMVADPGVAEPAQLLPMSEPAGPPPVATASPTAAASTTFSGRSQDGMTLGSILIDAEDRIATINGIPLREGETYEDFKVLRITPSAVQVQREGKPAVTLRAGR